MKTKLLILFSFLFSLLINFNCKSQQITAYPDYRGNLQVFDRGLLREIEYLPVKNYKIGGNCVAYIDNKNDFFVYYDGQRFPLVNAVDFQYSVTDNLVVFKVGSVLYTFDKGEKKTLCYYAALLSFNDSIIAYFDGVESTLNFYYHGAIANAEAFLLSSPKSIKTGSNTVAWVDQSNHFKVFYHGKTFELEDLNPIAYEAGRDIVAYIDDFVRKFHIFYKGENAIAEEFIPDSFKVGFGIMAYVDNLGNFRVFNDGATKMIIPNRPAFFQVKGNIVVYSYNNTFNVIYNNESYTLQNHAPADYQLGNDGVAWIDDSGRLMLFDKGKTYTVSYEIINSYFLNGSVLKYEVGTNSVFVFYEGKNF